jgi:hypothetical protein
VATGSVEKGKNVGRPPVNEEIPEDLRPQIEQSSKKSLQADIPFSTCQKIVNVFVASYKGWSKDCCLTNAFNCFYCKN